LRALIIVGWGLAQRRRDAERGEGGGVAPIEIAIGIEIVSTVATDRMLLANVASAPGTAEQDRLVDPDPDFDPNLELTIMDDLGGLVQGGAARG